MENGYVIKLTGEDNQTSTVEVHFQGTSPVEPKGQDELPHRTNYFLGNDPSKWRTGVPNYQEVVYEGIYDGIDLVFYAVEQGLKYDFLVLPGAQVNKICWSYEGAEDVLADEEGALHVVTVAGELVEEIPLSYQMKDGKKVKVSSQYWTDGERVNFKIGNYDPTRPLVIDPLIYSTFIGGSGSDYGESIVLDSENNAYMTGWTWSSNFTTTSGCFDDSYNGGSDADDRGDVFVCKLSSDGSTLLYSTFLGGRNYDGGTGISLDSDKNAYVTGSTSSPDFPTTDGCYDNSYNGSGETRGDVFVCKLNQHGSSLLYSTFIGGGNGSDGGRGIILDTENNAYVTGGTYSSDFPTTSACFDDSYNGNEDTFVFKLNADGSNLIYSTYVGGSNDELGEAIEVDSDNNAYVTGSTPSLFHQISQRLLTVLIIHTMVSGMSLYLN